MNPVPEEDRYWFALLFGPGGVPDWLEPDHFRDLVAAVDPAHPRQVVVESSKMRGSISLDDGMPLRWDNIRRPDSDALTARSVPTQLSVRAWEDRIEKICAQHKGRRISSSARRIGDRGIAALMRGLVDRAHLSAHRDRMWALATLVANVDVEVHAVQVRSALSAADDDGPEGHGCRVDDATVEDFVLTFRDRVRQTVQGVTEDADWNDASREYLSTLILHAYRVAIDAWLAQEE
jgi:hypothetical protein